MNARARGLSALAGALLISAAPPQDGGVTSSADGVAVHYEAQGPVGAQTLVFLHGWSNNRNFWRDHVARLAPRFRVVTIDFPGFGESGVDRLQWTMDAYAADVIAVLDDLEIERAVLVGFSMGGIVALHTAAESPDRVAGAVLVDVIQDPDARLPREAREAAASDIRAGWGDREWVRANGFSQATPASLIERYLESTPATPPEYWWTIFENLLRWIDEEAIAALEKLEVPLAAINSDLIPTDVEAYRRHVPDFNLRIMPGLGHLGVIWEETALFDRHLEALVLEMR